VGRLTGSLPFPRPCKLIQTPGFSKRHSHDAQFTLPRRSPRAVKSAGSPASEQSAHHAADQADWTAATAVMVSTAAATTAGRRGFTGFAAGAGTRARRWHDFGQQRLMLQRVEEAGLGIAARPLPGGSASAIRTTRSSRCRDEARARITCVRTGRPPRRRSGRLGRRHRGDGEHRHRDDGGAEGLHRIRRWRWNSRAPLARFRSAAPYAAAC
jgi:hypothetical protein